MSAQEIGWFQTDIRPTHIGAYKTRVFDMLKNTTGPEGFSWWNGTAWGPQTWSADEAYHSRYTEGEQTKEWRGLDEEPEL